jgi:hypothetical protein
MLARSWNAVQVVILIFPVPFLHRFLNFKFDILAFSVMPVHYIQRFFDPGTLLLQIFNRRDGCGPILTAHKTSFEGGGERLTGKDRTLVS